MKKIKRSAFCDAAMEFLRARIYRGRCSLGSSAKGTPGDLLLQLSVEPQVDGVALPPDVRCGEATRNGPAAERLKSTRGGGLVGP